MPIATVFLTSTILAFRGAGSARDLAVLGNKLPKCDPSQPTVDFGTPEFWLRLSFAVCLVLLGGLFAGLTLGESSLKRSMPGEHCGVMGSFVTGKSAFGHIEIYAFIAEPNSASTYWTLRSLSPSPSQHT